MDWLTSIKASIQYMEDHLLEDISVTNIAVEVGISQFYLQQGFKVMTGYTISEYLRNRKLISFHSGKVRPLPTR